MSAPRVYLSPPDTTGEERDLLLEAFDSNWLAPLGTHVDAFENELAARVGVPFGAAVSSGTAALHLALRLVGVGVQDEVIVPTLTFVATANAVRYLQAEPILLDSEPTNWTMDVDRLADVLRQRSVRGRLPAAIVSVDLLGGCPDYDALEELCGQYDIPLVEDAAESLGATFRGRPAGSFGACAAFSFNGNKIITTSGGGMLVSSTEALISRARFLASQARGPYPHYEHEELGYNYRLSNLLAAVGRGQLNGLDRRIARRREIQARYREAFDSIEGITAMPWGDGVQPNYWLTCVLIEPSIAGADRESIRLALEAIDIEARPIWKPLHLQRLYRGVEVVGGSVAEAIFDRGLCLPTGSSLSLEDQQRVIDCVLRVIRRAA
jgi:dTDP-4-amino-4,6-dideoxygalactose transaminase